MSPRRTVRSPGRWQAKKVAGLLLTVWLVGGLPLASQAPPNTVSSRFSPAQGAASAEAPVPTTRIDGGSPVLGSREHREQLRDALEEPLFAGLAALTWPDSEFWRQHSSALMLQLVLLVTVALLARSFRSWRHVGEEWSGFLAHPWMLGAFVAATPFTLLYRTPPPSWALVQWTVFAVSGATLATVTFRSAVKRWAIYGLAAVFLLIAALEVLAFPAPYLRLVVAAVGALGVLLLILADRQAGRDEEDRRGFRLLVRLSAGVLAVILGAEVLGFDEFARGLLESALATAFVVLAVALLLRLGRGAIGGVIDRGARRFAVLQGVGPRLAVGLSWLYQAVLILFAILEITDIWGLYASPLEALGSLWNAGFSVGNYRLTLGQLLLALLAVYLAYLVSTLLRSTLEGEVFPRRELDPGIGAAITTLLHYVLVTVGFFFAFSLLGFSLTNLALIVGALGVGVGMGLQDLVKNFFSGLVLLFERPVRVGDMVILGGEWGTIRKIGLRATTITTFDRSELIVPNGELTSERVTNWTLSDEVTRLVLPIGVAYGSDIEAVFRVLQEAAEEHPEVLEDPAPVVLFMGFGESSLQFELRVWVGSVDVRLPTYSSLHADIDRRFRRQGITIPFPQRDLHLKSMPEGTRGRGISARPPAEETAGDTAGETAGDTAGETVRSRSTPVSSGSGTGRGESTEGESTQGEPSKGKSTKEANG